jgi:hypothetical protein
MSADKILAHPRYPQQLIHAGHMAQLLRAFSDRGNYVFLVRVLRYVLWHNFSPEIEKATPGWLGSNKNSKT